MNKKQKTTMIVSIIALILIVGGVTFAYFTAIIRGTESASTIVMTGGTLSIVYTEGNEEVIAQDIYPREDAWITKTFTLTGTNTTDTKMNYELGLNIITNEFSSGYLTYNLTNTKSDSGTPISNKSNVSINTTTGNQKIGQGTFVNGRNQEHKYTLEIFFKDNGENQNVSQGAAFNAKIYVKEAGIKAPNNCLAQKEVREVTYDIDYDNCMAAFWYEGIEDDFANDGYTAEQIAELKTAYQTVCSGEEATYQGQTMDFDAYIESLGNKEDGIASAEEMGLISNVVWHTTYEPMTFSDGDEYTNNGYTYTYSQTNDKWNISFNEAENTSNVCDTINSKPVDITIIRTYTLSNNSYTHIGQTIPNNVTIYHTPEEAMAGWANITYVANDTKPFFLKHILDENDKIVESYVRFIVSNEMVQANSGMNAGTYTFRGGVDESSLSEKPIYEANMEALLNAFGPSKCTIGTTFIECTNSNYYGIVNNGGRVEIDELRNGVRLYYCSVDSSSYCVGDELQE